MSICRRAIFTEGFPSPGPLPPEEGIQAPNGFFQGLLFLAEGEADVGLAVLRVLVEDARRNRRHADVFDEMAAEDDVVVEAERAEVGADIVGGGRRLDEEPHAPQLLDESVALAAIEGGETLVVLRADRQGRRGGMLERRR